MKRMYWWPYGFGNGPRFELKAALRNHRLKQWGHEKAMNTDIQKRFEQAMPKLITGWEQKR